MKTTSKSKEVVMIAALVISGYATAHAQIIYSEDFPGGASDGYGASPEAGGGTASLSGPAYGSGPSGTGITITDTPESDPYAAGLRNYYITPNSVSDTNLADASFTFSLASPSADVAAVDVTLVDADTGAQESESFSIGSTAAIYGGSLSGFDETGGTFSLAASHYKIYFDYGTAYGLDGGTDATGSNSFSVSVDDILLKTSPSSSVPEPQIYSLFALGLGAILVLIRRSAARV